MRNLLRSILPAVLIDIYKQSKKNKKSKQRQVLKQNNQVITEENITEILKQQGVASGDVIMLHSSLSKIGYVQEGAKTVINSFVSIIEKSGTLVMPAFPGMGFNYDYLKTNPVFNIQHTPSKMGAITEEFRKMQYVKRSLHPTDSVCAFGKYADKMTHSHFNQLTPYNANSPFYKLVELHAKIILIGVDLNALTNFHTLEDAVSDFKFPIYHQTIFNAQLINELGKMLSMPTKVHNPIFSKKRKCNDFIKPFIDAGFMQSFQLGLATCYIINAFEMHHWMLKQYSEKGITLYTPQGS